MKKRKFMQKSVVAVICLIVLVLTSFMMFACNEPDGPTVNIVSSIEAGSNLNKGDTVTLLVAVSDNSAYTLSVDNEEVAKISGNKLTIISDVETDTKITVTVALNNSNVRKTIEFWVKAPIVLPTITLTADVADNTKLEQNDEVTFTASVSNGDGVVYTVDKPDIATMNGNVMTITGENIYIDTVVTVTATLQNNSNISASKSFVVKAPKVVGRVGDLTTELITALGSDNITVTGVVTDIYQDFNQSMNNRTNQYDSLVMMSDGAWYGQWNVHGSDNLIIDNYRRSANDGYTDAYNNKGNAIERLYIDKNNTVASQIVKNSMSIPSVWQAQHLWNHIDNLAQNVEDKFEYDTEDEVYRYLWKNEDANGVAHPSDSDLYLLTYLAYSLTPMLEDTFDEIYFVVENGQITKFVAQTEVLYYGGDTQKDADAMSYTTVELTFSDIGTTVVPTPTTYESPENVEYLEQAIAKMQNAKNYTFKTTDVTTYAPSTDEGDYTTSAVSAASGAYTASATTSSAKNYSSSVGTVGLVGQVTEDAVLLARTIKYQYAMDDNLYRTEYTGYKKIDDNTYDYFEYNSTQDALVGKAQHKGTLSDVLPNWDFSADIFRFVSSTTKGGVTQYTFELQDTQITRDIAMEVSMYSYASDAAASTETRFRIVVDDNGNVLSTSYPYSILAGYAGICTTVYSNVGDTAFANGELDGYIPRTVPTEWSEYTLTDYYYLHSTLCSAYGCYDETTETYTHKHVATADVIMKAIYGEENFNGGKVISLNALHEVFGDNLFGPWFDYDEETDGTYRESISLTTQSTYYDENGNVTDELFIQLLNDMTTAFGKEGFTLQVANSDYTGGETGRSDRWLSFSNGETQIVIQNNHTKYIWINIYNDGDWTISR